MDMRAVCATWVEGVFGAEPPPFRADFAGGHIGVAATYTLSDEIRLKVRCIGGRPSREVVRVSNAAEANRRLVAEASELVEAQLERLRQDPDWRTRMANCRPLASAYGVEKVCSSCSGRGRVSCQACAGTGSVPCPHCGGRGWRNCGSCGGTGGGYVSVQNAYGWTNQYVSCGACSGGMVGCYCAGTGKSFCTACSAGLVNCSSCYASGVQTDIHSAEVTLSVAAAFAVADHPDDFILRTARSVPEAVAAHSRLVAPGQRRPNSRSIGYSGECGFEDGELELAGVRTRIVAVGAATAVAATGFIDEACLDFSDRLEAAAGGGLPNLLAFADGNRLAASRLLEDVERNRPRTLRLGVARRALKAQDAEEKALTAALFSPEFLARCAAGIKASVDLHVEAYRSRLRGLYKESLRLFLLGAVLGLPFLRAFWLPPLTPYRTTETILLAVLAWGGLVGLVCGLVAIFRVASLQLRERRLLSERPAEASLPAGDALTSPAPDAALADSPMRREESSSE